MFNQKVNRTNEETYQLVLPWTEENVDRLTSEVERLEEISRERSAEADRYPGQEQKTEKVLKRLKKHNKRLARTRKALAEWEKTLNFLNENPETDLLSGCPENLRTNKDFCRFLADTHYWHQFDNFKELGISNDQELWDFLDSDGLKIIERKKIGYPEWDDAIYATEDEEEVYLAFHKESGKYIVYGYGYMCEGRGIDSFDELDYSFGVFDTEEEGRAYLESIEEGYPSVKEQIAEIKGSLGKDAEGIWLDAKPDGWNVKYESNLILEKYHNPAKEDILTEVRRYKELKEKCRKNGIELMSVYNKPREWNDNQRYYRFEIWAAGEKHGYDVHIPSKVQYQPRKVLDYFNPAWIGKLAEKEKKYQEEMAPVWAAEKKKYHEEMAPVWAAEKAERDAKDTFAEEHDCSNPPFSYEKAKELFAYIAGAVRFTVDGEGWPCVTGCDGTLKRTREWLAKELTDADERMKAEIFLENHGGFCDCEVLSNASSQDVWRQKRPPAD